MVSAVVVTVAGLRGRCELVFDEPAPKMITWKSFVNLSWPLIGLFRRRRDNIIHKSHPKTRSMRTITLHVNKFSQIYEVRKNLELKTANG